VDGDDVNFGTDKVVVDDRVAEAGTAARGDENPGSRIEAGPDGFCTVAPPVWVRHRVVALTLVLGLDGKDGITELTPTLVSHKGVTVVEDVANAVVKVSLCLTVGVEGSRIVLGSILSTVRCRLDVILADIGCIDFFFV
jgi:hypothetical protein